MPSPIEDYALAYLISAADVLRVSDTFLRSEELLEGLKEVARTHLSKHDADKFVNLEVVANHLAAQLEAGKVFEYAADDWAGKYVKYKPNLYPKFRDQFLSQSPIHRLSQRVGGRFYPDAFRNYVQREVIADDDVMIDESVDAMIVPASDRIVSLNHNTPEYEEIAQGLADLSDQFRGANDLEIDEAEKGRILSALAAASQLWEASQLKAMQVKVGVLMAVEDAVTAFGPTTKAIGFALLIDAIKAFVKSHAGIDLDKI